MRAYTKKGFHHFQIDDAKLARVGNRSQRDTGRDIALCYLADAAKARCDGKLYAAREFVARAHVWTSTQKYFSGADVS